MASAIEIQISARVSAPKNGRPITKEIIQQAIKRKANDPDYEIPGIDLRIVRWRHGGKGNWINNPHDDDASEWHRFARFLPQAAAIVGSITKVRSR
jgi:hypothetical protein